MGTERDKLCEQLQEMTLNYDIRLSQDQTEQLIDYLLYVLERNKDINVTAITNIEDAVILHLVDSLLFLPYIGAEDEFVDIGTGGGFPGVPLVICSGATGTLIDSVAKKVTVVSEGIERLGDQTHCSVQAIRAEELAKSRGASFTRVVARAVAPCNVLLEYASPLLCHGGRLLISKAPLSNEEWDQGLRAAALVGMTFVSRETYRLPKDMGTREILVFVKDSESGIKLPRRVGMARKRPLGIK